MLKRNTVFVVGAGASHEFGLPLGYTLGKEIERGLDIRFRHGHEFVGGDHEIYEAIREHLASVGESDPNPWLHACWRIRDALPHHNSIDNLIDNHAGDERIAVCGKLAIAKGILEAEKASQLWFNPTNVRNEIQFRNVEETWIGWLFRYMQEGRHRRHAADFFANSGFIIFNYDRCLEHYFFRALQAAYGISDMDAGAIVSSAPIWHVYGTVGALPWQLVRSAAKVSFGGLGDAALRHSASCLRTYSERQQGSDTIQAIQSMLTAAEAIVFLGFGYIDTNLNLLEPDNGINADLILGSTLGLSPFNTEQIKSRLASWSEPMTERGKTILLPPATTASRLLADYGRALA